jgi:hypothetical protein
MSLQDDIKKTAERAMKDQFGSAGTNPVDPRVELSNFAIKTLGAKVASAVESNDPPPRTTSRIYEAPTPEVPVPQTALTPFNPGNTPPSGGNKEVTIDDNGTLNQYTIVATFIGPTG